MIQRLVTFGAMGDLAAADRLAALAAPHAGFLPGYGPARPSPARQL